MTGGSPSYFSRDKCPLCGRDERESLEVVHPFEPVAVVKCPACGMMFSSHRLPGSEYLEYYVHGFGGERQRKGQEVNARVNASWFRPVIDEVRRRKLHPRALDVGSGYGYFLGHLHKVGFSAEGVELSRSEVEFAQEKWDCPTHLGTVGEVPLKHKEYELITCFEVIEHMLDPVPFLGNLKDLLSGDGYLIIMTDNFEGHCVKGLGPNFPKWIPHAHVTHFGPQTLMRAARQAGLDVVSLTSFTPWEIMLRMLIKRLLPYKGENARAAFSLNEALDQEARGTYRLHRLRRILNPYWARLTTRNDGRGALMGLVMTRRARQQ